jgi:hypothetical protein
MSWQPANDPKPGDRLSCDAIETVIVPRSRDTAAFKCGGRFFFGGNMTEFTQTLKHYCRNPRCRSKLSHHRRYAGRALNVRRREIKHQRSSVLCPLYWQRSFS